MPSTSPLLTDLYELNMIQAYLDKGEDKEAVFEFFVRRLPARRGFLLAAGLDDALDYLETLQFSKADIDWLKSTGRFRDNLLDYLSAFRFTGDVHAIPEGSVCFPNEPLIRITAPLPQAQLVESRLINILHYQTLIASKAARMVLAAPGKILSDFGLRTAHGAEAGLYSARASYLAGFAGAANVLAGERYGVPIVGTMAHSFVQVHDDEMIAFENFARARPQGVILLIDTYDTEQGARKVVELAPRLKTDGISIRGVRIDSGDLAAHARKVRAILDDGGLRDVIILVSGGINEDVLQTMMNVTMRRSTATASASISRLRSTFPRSTAPTSCRNTPASRNANCRKVKRPGRAASRSGAPTMPTAACATIFCRWKPTSNRASRSSCR